MYDKVVKVVKVVRNKGIVERVEMETVMVEGIVRVIFRKENGVLKSEKYWKIHYASPCPRPYRSGWSEEEPRIEDEVWYRMEKQAYGIFSEKRKKEGKQGKQLLLSFAEGL